MTLETFNIALAFQDADITHRGSIIPWAELGGYKKMRGIDIFTAQLWFLGCLIFLLTIFRGFLIFINSFEPYLCSKFGILMLISVICLSDS